MRSIKGKIVFGGLLITFLALFTLSILNYFGTTGIVLQQNYNSQTNLAQSNADKMDGWLNEKKALMAILCYDNLVTNPDQVKTAQLFSRILKGNPEFSDVYMALEDGTIIDGSGWQPPADFDSRKLPWYTEATKAGKVTFSSLYLDPLSKKVVVSIVAPIYNDQGKFLGVMGADLLLDTLAQRTLQLKAGQTGYAFLMGKDGQVLVHPTKELIMKYNILQGKQKELSVIGQKMAAGQVGHGEYQENNVKRLIAYAPLKSTGWSLAIDVPTKEITGDLNKLLWKNIFLSLVMVFLIGLLVSLWVAYLLKPLENLVQVTKELAKGKLNKQVAVKSEDEIGVLGKSFNQMVENLKELIQKIAHSSQRLSEFSESIAASSEQNATASEQVAQTIGEIAQGAGEQALKAEKGSERLDNLVRQINFVQAGSEIVHEKANYSYQLVEKGLTTIQNQSKVMEENKGMAARVGQSVRQLAEHSQEIDSIVETISSIADQTNLLALNAAIEAARAGDAGRGFAVVAEEVRKLAEESGQASGKIAQLIQKIQQGTEKVVEETQQAVAIGIKQDTMLAETQQIFQEIAQGVVSTREEGEKIVESVKAAQGESANTLGFIQEIASVAEENAAGAEQISASSQEQTATAQQIASSSKDLIRLAQELEKEVGKFTI